MKPIPLTPDEEFKIVLAEIGENLARIGGRVSEAREHSVGSHLKTILRSLGFKPNRDWKEKDWIGLHKSIAAAFDKIKLEIPRGREDFTLMYAKTILSNLKAETGLLEGPDALSEAPAA